MASANKSESTRPPVRRQSITKLLESGGFDWTQCAGAIYQINRGEEAIPSAPDDGTERGAARGSICQEVTRCPSSGTEGNACVTRVSRARTAGTHPRGDTRYRDQLSIGIVHCIASIVSLYVRLHSPGGEKYADERVRDQRDVQSSPFVRPSFATVIRAQFPRAPLSRAEMRERSKRNNATVVALKYEEKFDCILC